MEVYKNFAGVYDLFMQDVGYDEWVTFVEAVWKCHGLAPRLVLELGCGTGNITGRLSERGYDMIGLDISEDMLAVAREKSRTAHKNILYLQQDMREFELYGTVDAVLCLCDSLNYIVEEIELEKIFRLVDNYLNPGGLFIFDVNTAYKFQNILGENTFSEAFEDAAYIWENYYDEQTRINEYCTDFFVKEEGCQVYHRFTEIHYERAYEIEQIQGALEKAGLVLLAIYDGCTFEEPRADSERLHFICKEVKKGGSPMHPEE